eukprot:365412-Chlamydomonas_euryale.AAC.19
MVGQARHEGNCQPATTQWPGCLPHQPEWWPPSGPWATQKEAYPAGMVVPDWGAKAPLWANALSASSARLCSCAMGRPQLQPGVGLPPIWQSGWATQVHARADGRAGRHARWARPHWQGLQLCAGPRRSGPCLIGQRGHPLRGAGALHSRGLVDIYPRCNPNARRYTFRSKVNGALARHDRFYGPTRTVAHMFRCSAEGVPAELTDHRPVVLHLAPAAPGGWGSGRLRLPVRLLAAPVSATALGVCNRLVCRLVAWLCQAAAGQGARAADAKPCAIRSLTDPRPAPQAAPAAIQQVLQADHSGRRRCASGHCRRSSRRSGGGCGTPSGASPILTALTQPPQASSGISTICAPT